MPKLRCPNCGTPLPPDLARHESLAECLLQVGRGRDRDRRKIEQLEIDVARLRTELADARLGRFQHADRDVFERLRSGEHVDVQAAP